jgi:hypothetical protein
MELVVALLEKCITGYQTYKQSVKAGVRKGKN